MTEIDDLILGIITGEGRCLSLAEIESMLSVSDYTFETETTQTATEAVGALVARGMLVLVPKQEKQNPAAHGKPGDVRPGTIIRVSSEKYCIQQL